MTRKKKDDFSSPDKDSNASSDPLRKLHLKVPNPISNGNLPNIRKRDKNDRSTIRMANQQESRNIEDVPYTTTDALNVPPNLYSQSGRTTLEPTLSTKVNYVKPVEIRFLADRNRTDTVQHDSPSPVLTTTNSIYGQHSESPDSLDVDQAQGDLMYSVEPQSACSATEHCERKTNIHNIVSEIRMRAKNHHLRRNAAVQSDRGPLALRGLSPFLFHSRSNEDTRDEHFQYQGKHQRPTERHTHANFSSWLTVRGGRFSRNPNLNSTEEINLDDADQNLNTTAFARETLTSPDSRQLPSSASETPRSAATLNSNDISNFNTPASSTPHSTRSTFPRNFPLFGCRLLNYDITPDGIHNASPTLDGNSGGGTERFLASGKLVWTRRPDRKKRTQIMRRARSWNHLEHHTEDAPSQIPSETDDSIQLMRLNEQVRNLKIALLRSEQELSQLRIQTAHHRQETKAKLKRLSTAHTSLRDAQELRFRSALDVLNDNQKILGYVESNFDYVLSIVGSGRRRCPGLRGHFIGALRYLGDNTIELGFKIVRIATGLYARLKRKEPLRHKQDELLTLH